MSKSHQVSLFPGAVLVLGSSGCRTEDLADVQTVIPGIVLDIRYATTNNFTG